MQITYMIGNGFDINLGLKTGYGDFYKWLNQNNNVNKIIAEIQKKPELWCDLESALGKYTETLENDENKLNTFLQEKFELDMKLNEYLKIEENRIDWENNISNGEVRKRFFLDIDTFHRFFKDVERDEILHLKNNKNLNYVIMSFNYTNTIEKCNEIFGQAVDTLYLHGKLDKEDIILGVNDSKQISNELLQERKEMKISMCKLDRNNYNGKYVIQNAEEILKNSEIVCIFGMSLGETDKYWWENILRRAKEGYIKMIVIFNFNPNIDLRNAVAVYREEEKVKNSLLKYLSREDKSISEDLKTKIKVVTNSDIFKMDLIFKDDSPMEKEFKEKKNLLQKV